MGKPTNDNPSHLAETQAVLDQLVSDGSIVLGADGRYRTPEHHATWLALQEQHEAALYAEHLEEGSA